MAVLFTIDGQTVRCSAEVISIGRAPTNQISLPDDVRLASVHASFRQVAGRWIVEAKDGGPVRVGSGRPTQFAWLNPGDLIQLTEAGPSVVFVPETSNIVAAPSPIPATPRLPVATGKPSASAVSTVPGMSLAPGVSVAPSVSVAPGVSSELGGPGPERLASSQMSSTPALVAPPAAAALGAEVRRADINTYRIAGTDPPTSSALSSAGVGTVSRSSVIVAGGDSGTEQHGRSPLQSLPPWLLYSGGGGLVAALCICIGMVLAGRGSAPVDAHPSISAQPDPGLSSGPAALSSLESRSGAAAPSPAAASSAKDLKQALYCLELRTADGRRTVQVGSAWAVAPRRLVTSGDAARAIAKLQINFPSAFARHTESGQEFEIKGMQFHPQYEAAASRLDQARRTINEQLEKYKQTMDGEVHKKIEELVHRLDSEIIAAADECVNVNVATLELDKETAVTLPWVSNPVMKIGQRVTLVGHPLPRDNQLVDPDHPVPVHQVVGGLQHTELTQRPAVPARCLARFEESLKSQNWSGSPVLNSEGAVLGMYVRNTPPLPGAPLTSISTHDVTVLDGVRDLLSSK